MKIAYFVIAHRFLVTLDLPRIDVGVLARPAFDAVFHALQRPYHHGSLSSKSNMFVGRIS